MQLALGAVALFLALLLFVAVGVSYRTGRRFWRFSREHNRLMEQGPLPGECHRLRCNLPSLPGSDYCSSRHAIDDEWINAL